MTTAGQWRYIAQRMTGDGNLGEFLDFNLPLQGVEVEDVLSGHNGLSGTITPEYMRLKGPDGRPILDEWGAAIWAEGPDGEIVGGGILTHSTFDGPNWSLECTGVSGITIGLPYTEANFWVNVDPLDLYREIWRYVQRQPNSNLGLTIDGTTSPVRLGTDLIEFVEFDLEPDVSAGLSDPPAPAPVAPNRFANNADWRERAVKVMATVGWKKDVVDDALRKWLNKDAATIAGKWKGLTERETTIKKKSIEKIGYPPNPPMGTVAIIPPNYVAPGGVLPPTTPPNAPAGPTFQYDAYKLAWYKDHDLSATIDDLASSTPFDWFVTSQWYDDEIRHHARLGYPRLGRRRDDLRFVVGENIKTVPAVERDGSEYANEVLFLGAGEGSTQIMGRAFRREDNRLRKVAVISDPSVQDTRTAMIRARQELARRFSIEDVTDVILEDHPHAPMGSVNLGDEILVEGDLGWMDLEIWCRVVARRMSPDNSDAMALTLIRSDRLA